MVLACNASGSWVPNHFHPWGATYIPLSGSACFNTPEDYTKPDGPWVTQCVKPGEARWTSPLLRYNESFSPPTEAPTAAALRVIALAGFGDSCPRPIIMPVTNFDPAHRLGPSGAFMRPPPSPQ